MKILYVEDDPRDAELTRLELARSAPQIEVDVVDTRRAALERLAGQAGYDVVLTDIHLPDGDGLSLLAAVREREWPVAVVIVTGGGDEETAVAALKSGADDYVVKRADYLEQLPQTLHSAHNRHRAEIARHARALRVLYAEDNAADISLTRRHLNRHARHVHLETVHTAQEVLQRLPRQGHVADFDVLLLDYRLPGQTALELLRELLQGRRLDLPVVVVTGQGDEELALQVLRLGASDYVVKTPGYLYKLPSVLENAFYRAQIVREQAALRQSEAKYRTLVEQIPAITYIASLDGTGTMQYVSPQAERILGFAPGEYTTDDELWRRHLHPEDREQVLEQLRHARHTGEPLRSEFRVHHRDGRQIWLRNEATVVHGENGLPLFMQGILVDLTEAKQAEEQLRHTNETLHALIEAAPLAVSALDHEGCVTMWNPAAERLFGWREAEVLGEALPIVPAEHRAEFESDLEAYMRGARQTGAELKRLRKDGSLVDVSLWTAPLRDDQGRITGVMTLYADITERKQAEAERDRLHRQVRTANARLKALSMRLLEVQEAERRHIARELHDEIGQQLTGLKLLIDMNANQPGRPVRASLGEAQNLLQQLMNQVRELSLSLRPAMLDDLGLLPALLWHIERYRSQTGVVVNFHHSGIEGRRFPAEVETAAYRIIQEALTNVARYAKVQEAQVQLWRGENGLHLEVSDEGSGFDAAATLAANRSNGMAGMSERAALLGGQFKVESTQGAGTRLAAVLPLAESEPAHIK